MSVLAFKHLDGKLLAVNNAARSQLGKMRHQEVIEFVLAETDPGSDNMRKTWFMWMGQAAEWMAGKGFKIASSYREHPTEKDSDGHPVLIPVGMRPIDKDAAHKFFSARFLGLDSNGQPLSWNMTGLDPSSAGFKQRLEAMDKFLDFAEQEGIPVTIPRTGMYADYKEAQMGNGDGVEFEDITDGR